MAVTHDATSSLAFASNDAGPFVLSHTVGGGSDRLLLVWYGMLDGGSRTATGVTYNGQAMTRWAGADADEGLAGCEAWYLVNPPSGTANVSVSVSETISRRIVIAMSFAGVDQTTPIEAANVKTAGADTSPTSINLTGSTADSMVVNCYYMRDASGMAADAGQSNVTVVQGTDDMGVGTQPGGDATETATWTTTARGSNGAQSILSLKAAAGDGGVTLPVGALLRLGVGR